MNYRRNILVGISGIVISIGTLSTTASANKKPLLNVEEPLSDAAKLLKFKEKTARLADKAEFYAEQAEANAQKAEDCCSDFSGAQESRAYATKAREFADKASDENIKLFTITKIKKAKKLKNKTRDLLSEAQIAADNAEDSLNNALESMRSEFLSRATLAAADAEASAETASEAVSSAKDCCSLQEVDGDISDIEDAEEAWILAEVKASEAARAENVIKSSFSSTEADRFAGYAEEAAIAAAEYKVAAVSAANEAKKHPDDYSDMRRNCEFKAYALDPPQQNTVFIKYWNKSTGKLRYDQDYYQANQWHREHC